MQALIKDKKRKLLQEKLSENNENIGKPKELWKFIKKIGFTRQDGFHMLDVFSVFLRVDVFSHDKCKYFLKTYCESSK